MPAVARHVVIVGGGITGLAAAYALSEKSSSDPTAASSVTCTLIEASRRLGGKIMTEQVGDFVLEAGPDSFLAQKPWGIELCRRLGLSDQLIGTNPAHRRTFVLLKGRLHELPEGLIMGLPTRIGPFLRSSLLSWKGKLRLAAEPFIPVGPGGDESLGSYFRRRLGQEALDHMIEPLLTGIYTGNADELSLLATFPRFREMEQEHGSLLRAVLATKWKERNRKEKAAPPWTPFVTLRDGLNTLVQAISHKLQQTTILTGVSVRALRRHDRQAGYDVSVDDRPPLQADAVILTTPAYDAALLLEALDPSLAEELRGIPYASSVIVSLAFAKEGLLHDLDGYGFVVPRVENRRLIACTWASSKWEHRAPEDTVLIRCYLGGVGREAIMEKTDNELEQIARAELRAIVGIDQAPVLARVYRWPRAMPQYQVGHVHRLEAIGARQEHLPGLFLAGAAYRGVGVPDCIRDGTAAAEAVLRYFDKDLPGSV